MIILRRVVVTGLGIVSPIGNGVSDFWDNLIKGKNGIDYITSFDTANYGVKLGYEVKDLDMKDIPLRDQKFDSKYMNYARIAAKEASYNLKDIDNNRFGVYISTSIGGLDKTIYGLEVLNNKGNKRISPYLLQSILPNMASGKVAIDLGAKGGNFSPVAACSGGTIAIGEAFLKIKNNYEDVILAGASEACITELTVASFESLRAIYKGSDKEIASTPFDKRRSGFSIGEGAAVILLEELGHAIKRNAKIYAEIVGYACNCDANNVVAPDYNNLTCKRAIEDAIKVAGITPLDVEYINAHGTSTVLNDKTETMAIKEVFKGSNPYVSSTKGQTGHLLSASGAVEAVITIKALEQSTFPYMINYKEKDEECDLNFILDRPLNKDIKYAMSNSLGFGGHNASLVFRKWDGLEDEDN